MAERCRITFGVIWLIDAILKWLPGFRSGYIGMISSAGQGQSGWLHWWFSFWTNLQRPEVAFLAYSVAAAETLIAIAVIAGFARKVTYISAATLSVAEIRRPVQEQPALAAAVPTTGPVGTAAPAKNGARPEPVTH